jgi:N-acetylglucosaminyldiphosphoundecaprenol N-acetyl-beta-D-mannosaminyltransferase
MAVCEMVDGKPTVANALPGGMVLNTYIHALAWDETLSLISDWAQAGKSRYVCLCNVHSAVTAQSDQGLNSALEQADLVLPDGMPIAWVLRQRGFKDQPRIGGPDLMFRCCQEFERSGQSIFLYGSTPETLDKLRENLSQQFPKLKIAGALSPPFRELSQAEESETVREINSSGAGAVLVALGCPRQEAWMLRRRGAVHGVMLGLGAAFEFHAGVHRRAPLWMQRCGLEWLHRLVSEPGRLWKRYLVTNTRFGLSVLLDVVRR